MFKFLIVSFFMFVVLMALMGFSVLRMLRNFFFGNPDAHKKKTSQGHRSSSSSSSSSRRNQRYREEEYHPKRKIISDDEGEYVDYEEIK